jgi:hypothetical protein
VTLSCVLVLVVAAPPVQATALDVHLGEMSRVAFGALDPAPSTFRDIDMVIEGSIVMVAGFAALILGSVGVATRHRAGNGETLGFDGLEPGANWLLVAAGVAAVIVGLPFVLIGGYRLHENAPGRRPPQREKPVVDDL